MRGLEETAQMTLAEASENIGSSVTVGDAILFVGAAAIGAMAWILVNKYWSFKYGNNKDDAG